MEKILKIENDTQNLQLRCPYGNEHEVARKRYHFACILLQGFAELLPLKNKPRNKVEETKLTEEQLEKALALDEGEVVFSYTDDGTTIIETLTGVDPWKWDGSRWKRMMV